MIGLLIALFLISCSGSSGNKNTATNQGYTASAESLDTLQINPYTTTAKPEIFESAFFKGAQTRVDTLNLQFYAVDIGKINIESGKIIACDPIGMHDSKPFTQTFPIGQFPVQLAIAKFKNDERVAFSRIQFSNNSVIKWEFALLHGQDQVPIDGETLYGYGVDAGIGLFIDEKANSAFNELANKDEGLWQKVFTEEMDNQYRDTWQYIIYKFDGHNFACFSTGYGDGHYGTYVGYDANGNICSLLTDFGLVEWWHK